MTDLRAETLDYATAETGAAAGAPLREIVGASLAYGVGNWVAMFAFYYWYFIGRRKLSASVGEAAVQLSLRRENLVLNVAFETVMVVLAGVIVLLVQWWAWRVWPAVKRRAWPVAAAGGVGQCAAAWGLWSLSEDGLGWWGLAAVGGMAAGVGLILAWWRGR